MRRTLTHSDFRLTFAEDDFQWAGESRPGLPILRWPDGTICEPVLAFFGYSAEKHRVKVGSMKLEAYAIREWLAFLANAGRRWDEADDELLSHWRESHRERIAGRAIKATRVAQKIHAVFTFYRLFPEALPLNEEGNPRKLFVGKPQIRDGVTFPVSSKTPWSRSKHVQDVWSGAERVGRGSGSRRGTPDEAQVTKLLAWMRAKSVRQHSRRSGADAQKALLMESERNWLMGRCMVGGGLRAQEIADMRVDALAKALRVEGVPLPQSPTNNASRGPHVLDLLAEDQEGRGALLSGLELLEARGRTCIYMEVTGKGSKTRMVPFPIDLARDLLQVGIWGVRRAQRSEWAEARGASTPPQLLFLSFKTRGRMTSGAIGDLMKQAFRETGVEGSGHRLRAHFATMMAFTLLDECLAQNNYRLDSLVENMVLERLAEAMGHARVSTTLSHYIEMAKLRYFGASSRAKLDTLRGVQNALLRHRGALPPERMRLLGRIVEALATGPADSDLPILLDLALRDQEANAGRADPAAATPVRGKAPRLRLIDGEG